MSLLALFRLFRPSRLRAALLTGACAAALAAPTASAETALAIDPKLPPTETVALGIPKGQVEAAIAKLDDFATALMKRSGIPGMAVVVVHEGKTVYLKGFGVREAGKPETVDGDTVFQLASLSKAVGAGVVAHQVGEGVVTWDTPLRKLLPWFSLKDPWVGEHVTVADLYTHRSGLPDHAGDELEDLGFDRRQILERLKLLPLAPFRVTYAYTNFGLTAAAEGVAAASGKDWATLSDEVLYKPLGMSATSSRFSDYIARANRAVPHVRDNGAFVARYQRQPDAQSPAGGVSSSARDMGRWLAFVLGNGAYEGQQIAPAAALLPAITAQIVSAPSPTSSARAGFYGHGFNVSVAPSGRVVLSHSGAFILGAGTTFAMLPSEKIGITVLTNAQPVGAAEALAMQFMDYVQFGSITRDWFAAYSALMAPLYQPLGALTGLPAPATPEPARKLEDYAGTYANSYFGPATVRVEDGHLVLTVGPKPVVATLGHWSGDTFTYAPAGESAPPGTLSEVVFALKGKGAPTMTVEFFNENGIGTFTRQPAARPEKSPKSTRRN
ncbi:serine hydrolase [Xanthobacter sp. V0B-10]|uniref:serine hydrolase n=1 Tax=Xanthobacter albus TaxID=3119929 RepID=UPI00372B4BA0